MLPAPPPAGRAPVLQAESQAAATCSAALLVLTFAAPAAAAAPAADGTPALQVNYKLRDWLFARQRYWGEPFPIVFPEGSEVRSTSFPGNLGPSGTLWAPLLALPAACQLPSGVLASHKMWASLPAQVGQGASRLPTPPQPPHPMLPHIPAANLSSVALLCHLRLQEPVGISEAELPLRLPSTSDFQPSGTPEPPLAKVTDWVAATTPDGRLARRETSTMPQWAGSCWYYLRYIDPLNAGRWAVGSRSEEVGRGGEVRNRREGGGDSDRCGRAVWFRGGGVVTT